MDKPTTTRRVGRWTLDQRLGAGAFGTTWSARDGRGRRGALKFLTGPPGDELRALAAICHPAVVGYLDAGSQPRPYLVMELARGWDLEHRLRAGGLEIEDATRLCALLADALAAVHAAGIVHGDLKPANIVVREDDRHLWIVDFGLAGNDRGGTLEYASPEQFAGEGTSHGSDVYALGLVWWELLHGGPHWADGDLDEALVARRERAPTPLSGPDWLRELLLAMLSPDPLRRPDAAAVVDVCVANGVEVARPDAPLIRRRAGVVHLRRPWCDAVDRWVLEGGALTLAGHPGSGRHHALDYAVRELAALGTPFVRMGPGEHPWQPVETVLADPVLGGEGRLPGGPDDLTQADAAARLVEESAPRGLRIVVDREDALDGCSRLVVESWRRRGRVAVIATRGSVGADGSFVQLQPFDASAVQELVQGLLGGDVPDLAEAAARHAAGNPARVVDYVVGAVDEGVVVPVAGTWVVDTARLESFEPPQKSAELPALDGDAARLAATIAASTVPLSVADASRLSGISDIEGPLAVLVDLDLVDHGDVGLRCRSEGLRHALEEAHADPALHRRMADHLLAQPEPDLVAVAWQLVKAHDEVRLAQMGPDCLDAARQRGGAQAEALGEAVWGVVPSLPVGARLLRIYCDVGRAADAVALCEHLPSDDPEVVAGLAQAHLLLGDAEQSLAVLGDDTHSVVGAHALFRAGRLDEAIVVAQALTGPEGARASPEAALELYTVQVQALLGKKALSEAIALAESIPDGLGRGSRARALFDAAVGRLLWHAGRFREAAEILRRVARSEYLLSVLDRARLLNNAGAAWFTADDRARALVCWERALVLFQRLDDALEQVRVNINLCVAYREAGRWKRAQQAGELAREGARALGEEAYVAMAAGNLGDLARDRERWDEASAWYDTADELATKLDLRSELLELARRRTELLLLRGEGDVAGPARRTIDLAEEAGNVEELARGRAMLALALARSGNELEVEALIEQAVTPLVERQAAAPLAEVRLWGAEALATMGRFEDSLAMATRAQAFSTEVGHAPLRARADRLVEQARKRAHEGRDEVVDRALELMVALSRHRQVEPLLTEIVSSVLSLTAAERAFVVLGGSDRPEVAAEAVAEGVSSRKPSMTVLARVLADGREVLAADVGERADLSTTVSVMELELSSVLCVPMFSGTELVGALYIDSRSSDEIELHRTVRILRALAAQSALAITNARYIERARERIAHADGVAHDLRNAISAMLAATELMSEAHDDEERERILQDQKELGAQAIELARGFLERRSAERVPLDLVHLVSRMVRLLSHAVAAAGVQIEVDAIETAPILGNASQLERAVINVVDNAIKHTAPGDAIHVEVGADETRVWLRVHDSGPGLPEGTDVFRTGSRGTTARPGYGLGLAIVKQVARDHGGGVDAYNSIKGGAVIEIVIPRTEG